LLIPSFILIVLRGGKMGNKEIIDLLDRMKSALISQAANGNMPDNEYKEIRNIIIRHPILKRFDISFIKSNLTSLEFRRYMQEMYGHYVERRTFITNKVNELICAMEDVNDNIVYRKTGWDKIDDSVNSLIIDLNSVEDRIDINQIGVRCRETIIELADIVYKDEIHHPSDYPDQISSKDAKRKLNGYFEYKFKGSSNKEKKRFSEVL
jgi:hypothetical protein